MLKLDRKQVLNASTKLLFSLTYQPSNCIGLWLTETFSASPLQAQVLFWGQIFNKSGFWYLCAGYKALLAYLVHPATVLRSVCMAVALFLLSIVWRHKLMMLCIYLACRHRQRKDWSQDTPLEDNLSAIWPRSFDIHMLCYIKYLRKISIYTIILSPIL